MRSCVADWPPTQHSCSKSCLNSHMSLSRVCAAQADILQVPVVRPVFQETTVLGAALAAGLGAGVWSEERAFSAQSYSNTEFRCAFCIPVAVFVSVQRLLPLFAAGACPCKLMPVALTPHMPIPGWCFYFRCRYQGRLFRSISTRLCCPGSSAISACKRTM